MRLRQTAWHLPAVVQGSAGPLLLSGKHVAASRDRGELRSARWSAGTGTVCARCAHLLALPAAGAPDQASPLRRGAPLTRQITGCSASALARCPPCSNSRSAAGWASPAGHEREYGGKTGTRAATSMRWQWGKQF